jgi:hypothetical protein
MGYGPNAWRMIGRGIELGAIIGGATFLGHLGDERWDTGPWLTLSGALLATVGGCYNLAKDMLFPKKPRGPGAGPDGG